MTHAIHDLFQLCTGYFDEVADLIEEEMSITFRRVFVGDYKVVQMRCGAQSDVSREITRVFDREGNPVEKVKLTYTEQRAWFKRLVVQEGFPAASVMELLDEQSRDFFWRERMQ